MFNAQYNNTTIPHQYPYANKRYFKNSASLHHSTLSVIMAIHVNYEKCLHLKTKKLYASDAHLFVIFIILEVFKHCEYQCSIPLK